MPVIEAVFLVSFLHCGYNNINLSNLPIHNVHLITCILITHVNQLTSTPLYPWVFSISGQISSIPAALVDINFPQLHFSRILYWFRSKNWVSSWRTARVWHQTWRKSSMCTGTWERIVRKYLTNGQIHMPPNTISTRRFAWISTIPNLAQIFSFR